MFSVMGCSMTTEIEALVPQEKVIKSLADNRNYRYLTMENALKVLLISDPDTDKSAAAADVNVGSYQDPDDRLGLSHFLEHMLFMGTEKYPNVDDYSKFIRANGGSTNAYTANVHTNFYFDINSDQLQPALDRFAQFFISPNLNPDYVERERHAVDSEYRLHTRSDYWRLFTTLNATSNPDHPKSRFNIGNLNTLHDQDGQLLQDLKDFYAKYYVASNIGLVVYGKESLDQLEQWVKEIFSAVPAGDKPELRSGKQPYTDKELQVRINIEPLKDAKVLSLIFPMPSIHPFYHIKPLGYLARIIGFEGKGSLHSLLKEQGLIDSLAAYNTDIPTEFSEFIIRMELTQNGLDQIDEITAIVFDYLDLISKEGIHPWLYEESKQISELSFRYQENRDPKNTVSELAGRIHDIAPEHLLSANYLYEFYDPELIMGYVLRMTASNLRQVVMAKNLPTDKTEPYFQTKYSISPLSEELVDRLHKPMIRESLTIPEPNTFIAENLKLKTNTQETEPSVILDELGFKVWSMTDTSFSMPRGNINILINSPSVTSTDKAEEYVLLQLYKSLLLRSLNEYGYPAKEAGLNYGITAGQQGIIISLAGYQDKQYNLLDNILKSIKSFKPHLTEFEQEKAILDRKIKNKKFRPPYRQGMDALNQVSYPFYPDDKALLDALSSVNFEEMLEYPAGFYSKIHIEMMVYGNHSRADALKLASLVKSKLLNEHNRKKRFDPPFYLLGDTNRVLNIDVEHDDSTIISYYQIPYTSKRQRAKYALLGRILANPFFSTLRSEQQLGYVVFSGPRPFENHPGLVFVVQSPKLDPIGIEKKIDQFLLEQKDALTKLTDKDLGQYRQGLINDLLKKDDNMDERNSRLWHTITTGEQDFNERQKIADEVNSLVKSDMISALKRLMENRGKLVIRSFGIPHQNSYMRETNRIECHNTDCFDDLPISVRNQHKQYH